LLTFETAPFFCERIVFYYEIMTVLLTALVFIGWESKYIFLMCNGILEFDNENIVGILL
jgi:hypothetical protein